MLGVQEYVGSLAEIILQALGPAYTLQEELDDHQDKRQVHEPVQEHVAEYFPQMAEAGPPIIIGPHESESQKSGEQGKARREA